MKPHLNVLMVLAFLISASACGPADGGGSDSGTSSFRRKLAAIFDDVFACTPKSKLHYVITLAGSGQAGAQDGQRLAASFNYVKGLAMDKDGNLLVADALNHKIRKVSPQGFVSTIAGTGAEGFTDGSISVATFS